MKSFNCSFMYLFIAHIEDQCNPSHPNNTASSLYGKNRPEREAGHSRPSKSDIKNECSYVSTSPHALTA
jgi:hypothetical protein